MTGVTHEQIPTDLQGPGVDLALEAGALRVKRSRDLRAVQIHILLEDGRHVRWHGRHLQVAPNLQQTGLQHVVETGAVHVDMSGNLRVGQIDILESGLVLSVGIHEQRAADLQEAGGERAVEIVADQADISRDLRALQRYLLKSGLVLTSGWRKQIDANFQQVAVQRTIEAGPEHVDLSTDLCVDETHFVETGLVLVIGVHGQIAADTHLARIQLAVESGAGELDASIDLGAVEVHLTSENAAIAQPQIALGMQTGGIEDAVHERAFQPDQTVRARADQVDRAFDPAGEDRDRSNELHAFEIEIPDDAGTFDLNSRGGDRLPPRRSREQILQKACGESAAVVAPARILLVIGVERRRVAALVEIGHFAPLDLGQRPAFGGVWVAVGLARQISPNRQPSSQRPRNGNLTRIA